MAENTKGERPIVTVGAVVLNDENKVLVLQSKHHFGKLALPAGHVEYGEKLIDAVKREVKEETGLDVIDISLLRIGESIQSPDYMDQTKHFVSINFLCKATGEDVTIDQNEAEGYKWMDPQDILKEDVDILTRGSLEELLKESDGRA